MRRLLIMKVSCSALAACGVFALAMGPASAHAIIDLNGVSAVAGSASPLTLEIQHGCLPAEATTSVEAFVGKPWRAFTPGVVPGWQATVAPLPKGGWHITWTNLGQPIPFGTATFFPVTVEWPAKPGTYSMRVTQQCTGGTSYDWNQKFRPATATSPSPPLTPRPEVQVVGKGKTRATGAP